MKFQAINPAFMHTKNIIVLYPYINFTHPKLIRKTTVTLEEEEEEEEDGEEAEEEKG